MYVNYILIGIFLIQLKEIIFFLKFVWANFNASKKNLFSL